MAIIVKGSGGKPEEEKTVTAGTSAIEVLPSSGKVMKKVTVNPTPSETKTVTPKASKQTVSPSSGKLLSKVKVNGDADLVAGNIKSGVNIFGVTGTLEEGAKVASGTISLSSSANSLTIPHNLGKIPTKFAIMPISNTFDFSSTLCSMGINDTIIRAYYEDSSPYSGYFGSLDKSEVTMNETNIIVPCYFSDLHYKYYKWLSGTYHWIVIAE